MSAPADGSPAKGGSQDRGAEDASATREHDPNAVPAHDEKPRPDEDAAETMQHDHDSATGRQRYGDARPGEYSHDFEADGSVTGRVEGEDGSDPHEGHIPDIAQTEPPDREK